MLEVVFCHRKPTPQTEENFGPQHMAGDQSMDPLHLFLHGETVHDFDEMPNSFSMHSHAGTAAAAAAAAAPPPEQCCEHTPTTFMGLLQCMVMVMGSLTPSPDEFWQG